MPTANERRALWFLSLVALSGTAVRLVRARSPDQAHSADAQLDRQLARVDSARVRKPKAASRKETATRKPAPDTARPAPVDLDRATAAEIEALPGIGPALATRIIAHRDSAGLFGSFAGFCRVRGVGPAMVERLRPSVAFSGVLPDRGGCEPARTRTSKSHVTNRGKPR